MYQPIESDLQLLRQRATQLAGQISRNRSGTLSDDELRPLRLQNGLYIQRHAPMLRIAIAYGMLNSQQLRALAAVARLDEAFSMGRMAIAFSGQMEDSLLLWRAAFSGRSFNVFMLDTGRLHQETLDYSVQIERQLKISITRLQPDILAVVRLEQDFGAGGIYESVANRKRCCDDRKVAPLRTYLAGFSGWITGQRREQSTTRGALALREPDTTFSLTKFNPLADFSLRDVKAALASPGAPAIHPLHDRGYPSIGCRDHSPTLPSWSRSLMSTRSPSYR